jgi:transcriptional regulator with XRE-family HTH domain
MQFRDLNQVELSKISGVSQTLISSYLRESAKAKYPSLPNLAALIEALECRLEDMIDLKDTQRIGTEKGLNDDPTNEQRALWDAYSRLPDGHWLKIMIKQELLKPDS